MKAIIDRFEVDTAVLTPSGGGKSFNLPKASLPPEAQCGTTVLLLKGSWVIDADDTQARRKRIAEKARQMFNQ